MNPMNMYLSPSYNEYYAAYDPDTAAKVTQMGRKTVSNLEKVFEDFLSNLEANNKIIQFPRQSYKPLHHNAFQKVYYENMLMELVRKINNNPNYIARIVMGKVGESNFGGRGIVINEPSIILDSWPVQAGKSEITRSSVEKLINEVTQKAMSRKNGI